MQRIVKLLILAAVFSLGPRATMAQASYPFQTHAVPLYQGATKSPDFSGRDRAFANYRTRIRDGLKQGVNFSGRYSLIQFGCGTGCTMGYLTDVSSGQVYEFPRGGDDNLYMQLRFAPKSSLIVLRWYGPAKEGAKPDAERCFEETLVWRNARFDPVGRKDIGDEEACLTEWPRQ